MVQLADQCPHTLMLREGHQMPVQLHRLVPLPALGELVAHEQQFFAGVGEHVAVQQPESGKTLPVVSRHFGQHGAFAVNHFVV